MGQQDTLETTRQDNRGAFGGARDLMAKLYREIGISAVAAALESNKRPAPRTEDQSKNPAVVREERAA